MTGLAREYAEPVRSVRRAFRGHAADAVDCDRCYIRDPEIRIVAESGLCQVVMSDREGVAALGAVPTGTGLFRHAPCPRDSA